MAQLIEVPNHGVVEFPDDMSEQDIVSAIKKNAMNYKPEASLGKKALTLAANKVKDYANIGFGAIRGAGSIGATLAAPYDIAKDAYQGKGLTLESNNKRRDDLTGGLSNLGADINSSEYGLGKIAAEIAGTSNIGGVIAKPLQGVAPRLANAIASGGFNLGSQGGNAASNAALRVGGGAISGGVGAGVINPEDAGTGAMIGGAIPALGKAGYETFKAGGNAIRPFTKSGQQQILTNNLVNMLGDKADDVAARLATAKGNTPGFNPTAGQVGNSAELAAFERMFKQRNAGLFDDAIKGQSSALANAANSLGGDDLARINLVNAREEAVKPLYESAKNQRVVQDDVLNDLINRPAFKEAASAAEINALNNGEKFVLGETINMPGAAGASHTMQQLPDSAYFKENPAELISGGKGKTLLQQIRSMGGINQSHLRDITGEKLASKAKAQVGLFNKNGLGADDLASQLHDLGYIPSEEMAVDGGVGYLKEAVRNSVNGQKMFALDDLPLQAPASGQMVNDTIGDVSSYFNQQKGNKVYSGKSLQEVKFALDRMKNFNPMSSADAAKQAGVINTSKSFNNWLSDVLPDMRKADEIYAAKSKPINQLDIGNEIRDRFIPARYRGGSALDTPLSFNRNALATIFNDTGDTLAKKVTGFKGSTLKGELSPEQFKTIENLVKDNSLVDAGETLGRGLGSPTYQHLAYNSKGEGAGMLSGLLGGKLGMVANLAKGARDIAMTKPLRSMDAQMANMLQNPNSTGALIQEYLTKQNVKQPVINEVLKKYGLLNVPSVLISQ